MAETPLEPIDVIFDLAEDGRFDAAIEVLDQHLVIEPSVARLHALRAFLLLACRRAADASASVQHAQALDADDSYVQHARAEVALALSEPAEAIEAARRAHALDPDDDEAIFLEGRARALLGQWEEVVARMDFILAGDRDHEAAAMLRASALEAKNGRQMQLGAADWADLSSRFPLNPFARSGYAWTLLTRGRPSEAREEFRQALAIDPGSAWAREGMVLALKARYPGYGVLLRCFLWLQSFPPRTRTLIVIGGVVGYNFLRRIARDNPELKPFVVPVLVAYIVFVLASWLADPLLNLALMRHPEGRAVLSEDDRKSGITVGATLGAGILLAIIGLATPWDAALLSGLVVGFSSLTVAAAYNCAPGKYRRRLLGAAALFVVLGLASAVAHDGIGGTLMFVAIIGIAISTWVGRSWAERSFA